MSPSILLPVNELSISVEFPSLRLLVFVMMSKMLIFVSLIHIFELNGSTYCYNMLNAVSLTCLSSNLSGYAGNWIQYESKVESRLVRSSRTPTRLIGCSTGVISVTMLRLNVKYEFIWCKRRISAIKAHETIAIHTLKVAWSKCSAMCKTENQNREFPSNSICLKANDISVHFIGHTHTLQLQTCTCRLHVPAESGDVK